MRIVDGRVSDELPILHDRIPVYTVTPFFGRLLNLGRKARRAIPLPRSGDRRPVTAPPETGSGPSVASASPSSEAPIAREGKLVRLRAHVVANRPAFQRWYADEEIARLLRHDQRPLNAIQSRGYFDTIIMPLSARGMCYAIHEVGTDRLVGTTALTDVEGSDFRSALFRIVIGEKDCWGLGYGTEATHLVVEEAFQKHGLDEVRLEVFRHNARALAAYRRVGFRDTGSHVEFVGRERFELHVMEMALDRDDYDLLRQESAVPEEDDGSHLEDSITLASPAGRTDA
jgi:RimJ/RimL family protein N-acetyltransferase